MAAHGGSCNLVIVECPSRDVGCNWKGARKELEGHSQYCNLCTLRPALLQIEAATKAIELLQEQFSKPAEEDPILKEEIAKLAAENPILKEQVAKLAEETPVLKEQVAKLVAENPILKEEIAKLAAENPRLKKEIAKLAEENPILKDKFADLALENPILREQVAKLVQENVAIRKQNNTSKVNAQNEDHCSMCGKVSTEYFILHTISCPKVTFS